MSKFSFEAVVFDLDGVLTKTALVHSAAWKKAFDDYLKEREQRFGEPFVEFTHEKDYLLYVDGKPRYEGVRSFLGSRGIDLPYGTPEDSAEQETICGIGNRKNSAFNEIIKRDGVQFYPSSAAMIAALKEDSIKVAVASSSKNCAPILRAAGYEDLAASGVDGVVSAELGLKGKPYPDIFTTACERLGSKPETTIVVEDAVSGVQAGRNGSFGLVLGIAREGNAEELLANGADIVVADLEELSLEDLDKHFRRRALEQSWSITYSDYLPDKERSREPLLAVGNGYLCTRGSMEEAAAGLPNYPGTYMAGIYNRLFSRVADREIPNEDLVNCINWLPITFRIGDGDWLDINNVEILRISRTLHLAEGILTRDMIIRDTAGHETRVISRRLAGMHNPHVTAISYCLTPLNYSAQITIRAGLHGDHINAGVERYKQLNQQHLEPVIEQAEGNLISLAVRTTESKTTIAQAAKVAITSASGIPSTVFSTEITPGRVDISCKVDARAGSPLTVEKLCALYTSRDGASDPLSAAKDALKNTPDFSEVAEQSKASWQQLWREIDVVVDGDTFAQKMLRLNLYHSIISASPHNAELDAGLPARGLHGEAYRGHVFWDELFIMPLYSFHLPETARSLLMYRCRRLDAARNYAAQHGYRGAMFPWQSGSNGAEETQVLHLNPLSGLWGPDYSTLQRHVSLAVAFNLWNYYHITGDAEFMVQNGAETVFEICRFWASSASFDEATERYSISKVMGPDEFHEKYPGAKEGGLKDNSYTNIMVSWLLTKAVALVEQLGDKLAAVRQALDISDGEIAVWDKISRRLNIVVSEDGILAQYDGYFDLKELDWEAYRQKYGNIYRMDRLLKAEGSSPDAFKVSKQADVLMTFYNLGEAGVAAVLERLGINIPYEQLHRNFEYYLARTSHGSTLSRLVHGVVAASFGRNELAWELYREALASDYQDIQGGTTAEGIHLGVMTGSVLATMNVYGGIDTSGDILKLKPCLPSQWERLSFRVRFRGNLYIVEIAKGVVRLEMCCLSDKQVVVEVNGAVREMLDGQVATFSKDVTIV